MHNFWLFTANTLTIPGFTSMLTRLATNTLVLAEALSALDASNGYTFGFFFGTLASVLVGFSLP